VITVATDFRGTFIGARDSRTGRFVPNARLSGPTIQRQNAPSLRPRIRSRKHRAPAAPVVDREIHRPFLVVGHDGRTVRKADRVRATNEGGLKLGRAGFGDGKVADAAACKRIGARTALNITASKDQMSRMMRRDRRDRRVRVSYVAPSAA
jgi:hypothetical protein